MQTRIVGRSVGTAGCLPRLCFSLSSRLSGSIPSCVGAASALQLLRLGGNALTGGLLPLPPNSRLRVLNMTGNQMDGTHRIVQQYRFCGSLNSAAQQPPGHEQQLVAGVKAWQSMLSNAMYGDEAPASASCAHETWA